MYAPHYIALILLRIGMQITSEIIKCSRAHCNWISSEIPAAVPSIEKCNFDLISVNDSTGRSSSFLSDSPIPGTYCNVSDNLPSLKFSDSIRGSFSSLLKTIFYYRRVTESFKKDSREWMSETYNPIAQRIIVCLENVVSSWALPIILQRKIIYS